MYLCIMIFWIDEKTNIKLEYWLQQYYYTLINEWDCLPLPNNVMFIKSLTIVFNIETQIQDQTIK